MDKEFWLRFRRPNCERFRLIPCTRNSGFHLRWPEPQDLEGHRRQSDRKSGRIPGVRICPGNSWFCWQCAGLRSPQIRPFRSGRQNIWNEKKIKVSSGIWKPKINLSNIDISLWGLYVLKSCFKEVLKSSTFDISVYRTKGSFLQLGETVNINQYYRYTPRSLPLSMYGQYDTLSSLALFEDHSPEFDALSFKESNDSLKSVLFNEFDIVNELLASLHINRGCIQGKSWSKINWVDIVDYSVKDLDENNFKIIYEIFIASVSKH